MTTTQKLEKAIELIKRAEKLVKSARVTNKSLKRYYGYSLEIIGSQLNIVSDNSNYYATRDTNLQEILEEEGENWQDK